MIPVGYLTNTAEGLAGEPSLFYDYILASNGLFIRARGPLLAATVRIAEAEVRGLLPLEERVELPKGKIPQHWFDFAMFIFTNEREVEHYFAIIWEEDQGGYCIKEPPQQRGETSVKYATLPNTVVDIHSHGSMGAFFSNTDDQDEQGLRLYMVVGKLNTLFPEVRLRVGVYGYFRGIPLEEVFQ